MASTDIEAHANGSGHTKTQGHHKDQPTQIVDDLVGGNRLRPQPPNQQCYNGEKTELHERCQPYG